MRKFSILMIIMITIAIIGSVAFAGAIETPKIHEVGNNELRILNKVVLDNKSVPLEKPIYKDNNVIMVPLRSIVEPLDYTVIWEAATKSVYIHKNNELIDLEVGDSDYKYANINIFVDLNPIIVNNTSYVPLNFITEVLNIDAYIDSDGVFVVTPIS